MVWLANALLGATIIASAAVRASLTPAPSFLHCFLDCDADHGFRPRTCPLRTIQVDLYGTSHHRQSIPHHGAQVQATGLQPTKRREHLLLR